MTKKALAEVAGVTARSLVFFENGELEPSSSTVERMGECLSFPVDFFYAEDLQELPEGAASFRAATKLTARQRDQAVGAARLALELSAWIERRFKLPTVDIPKLGDMDPETAAEAVRKEFGLGERPVKNMIHLLEAHGVRVFSLAEDCVEVDAFSFWLEDVPFIFLNTMKSAERSRMDAGHELGHLVLHWGDDAPSGKADEREAQTFGAAFLMPRSSMLAEFPPGALLRQLLSTKRRWGVAVSNLAYRLHTIGLLTDWQYRSTIIEISQKGYRSKEPDGLPRETSQVLAKVLEALRSEGVTVAGIAEDLHVPTEELKKMLFGLVLTTVAGNESHQKPREASAIARHLELL